MSNQSNQVPTITVGQYDNGNKLVFNLTKDNLVESISGATIKLKFKEKNKGYEIKRQCKINDSEMAEVEYVLTSEDTMIAGEYITEMEIHYANGTILSKYNPFYLIIEKEQISRY